ncbi:MAG: hypothetical protein M3Y87_07450 [Myxococcota bacterium]|nr:hypothetical protein [Myxococcota bacterium]
MQALIGIALAVTASSCSLDRVSIAGAECTASTSCEPGQQCIDGRCITVADAQVGMDASVDGGELDGSLDAASDAPLDSGSDGGPDHCRNATLDGDETDVDCGGACVPCASCARCGSALDCATGDCVEGRCAVVLSSIVTPAGATIPAFVRDGAVLLAHYRSGAYHRAYDPHQVQRTDTTGGSTPPAGWAPDPCRETGHLDFRAVDPAGREVRFECDEDLDQPATSVTGTLFESFEFGDHGTFGATGEPGWAMIASIGSGLGRSSHAACGAARSTVLGGVAYCGGAPATLYSNHLVSFAVGPAGSTYVGCGRTGCDGPICSTHVWIWADAP